ncbi:MAG: hypothetical protein KF703_00835 [Actinobacteria bacterium]|nr:hypothetical protein [Actinomycetota bacterium]
MRRALRLPPGQWTRWASLALVIVALPLTRFTPLTARFSGGVLAVALMALSCIGNRDRLAWWWGFLIPIDYVAGVPSGLLDAARYGAVIWMCLRFLPDLSEARRPIVVRLATLVAVVGTIRGLASVARTDRFGMMIAAVMVVGALTAPFVAWRVRTHRTILAGFLGGVLLSAVVSLMQGADIPTLQYGNQEGNRFPGLASSTMLITWHLAFALIVAVYFLSQRSEPRFHRILAAVTIPVGLAALVGNGAQGGLLGLACAALAMLAFGWRSITPKNLVRYGAPALGVVVVIGALVVAGHIKTPTIDGLRGVGGYRNETARWTVAEEGARKLAEHPLVGVGRTNFEDEFGLAPHFLPLEAGITAGVVPFAVAMYLLWCLARVILRGPVGRRPEAWLGLALCAAMFGNTLTETGGPFTGLPRFSMLLIAVIACQGERWPAIDGSDDEEAAAAPEQQESATR